MVTNGGHFLPFYEPHQKPMTFHMNGYYHLYAQDPTRLYEMVEGNLASALKLSQERINLYSAYLGWIEQDRSENNLTLAEEHGDDLRGHIVDDMLRIEDEYGEDSVEMTVATDVVKDFDRVLSNFVSA